MHRITILALFSLLFSTGLPAQSGGMSAAERMLADMEARFAAFDREKERNKQWEQWRFFQQAEKFVKIWNAFVRDYNQGVVDVRRMREVSKAFRQMEKAGGWPMKNAKRSSANAPRTPPETASPPGDTASAR